MPANEVQTEFTVGGIKELVAATRVAEKAMKGYGKNADKELGKLQQSVSGLVNRFTSLSTKMKVVAGVGFSGLVVGAAAAIKTLGFLHKELWKGWEISKKYQKSFAIMSETFSELSKAGDVPFQDAIAQMEELHKASLFTKSAILDIQATLARTTRNAEVFAIATQAAVDVAAAKDTMSPEAAAQWITTILGDPGRAVDKLRRAEIQVSLSFQKMLERLVANGQMQEAQLLVLAQITKRFAGAAEAAANTVVGRQQTFAKDWYEVMRQGADIFSNEFAPAFESMIASLAENKNVLLDGFKAAASAATVIVNIITPMLETALALTKWADENMPEQFKNQQRPEGTPGKQSDAAQDSFSRDLAWFAMRIERIFSSSAFTDPNKRREYAQVSEMEKFKLTQGLAQNRITMDRMASGAKAAKEKSDKEKADSFITGALTFEERRAEYLAKQKVLAEQQAEAQKEFERSLKRVQVYVRDTSTHWEKFAEQERKIREARGKAAATGNLSPALDAQLNELQRRLYLVATETQMEIDTAPLIAFRKEQEKLSGILTKYQRKSPVVALMQDFEKLKALRDPSARLEGFELIAQELQKLIKGEAAGGKGFSSVSVGIEQLNSTIRSSALTRSNTDIKDEVAKQAALDRANATAAARTVSTAIHATRTSVAGGP